MECRPFYYSGCRGNSNRFNSKEDCMNQCGPKTPKIRPIQGLLQEDILGRVSHDLTDGLVEIITHVEDLCSMEVSKGPCHSSHRRYFSINGVCMEFDYTGCRGNANNFATLDDCRHTCDNSTVNSIKPTTTQTNKVTPQTTVEITTSNICLQPQESGPCEAYSPSYAYNADTNDCVAFIYGGCEGNSNRFKAYNQCMERCENTSQQLQTTLEIEQDICSLSIEIGDCRATIEMYAFHPSENQCRIFFYGGCGGNQNKFKTYEACMNRCGNQSEYETTSVKIHTVETDTCMLPVEIGPCRASMLMYAFYPSQGRCRRFYYGGCSGNPNRFRTYEACMNRCANQTESETTSITPFTTESDMCMMPAETGNCRARIPMYAYYPSESQCRRFYYGGCGGNPNKFPTYETCMNRCGNQANSGTTPVKYFTTETDMCMMPAEIGNCRARILMYAYYSSEGQCRRFYYGGCGGNPNKFPTYETCMNRCGNQANSETTSVKYFTTETDMCMMPAETGNCRARIPMYAYYPYEAQCRRFYYGGCGGNSNKFQTYETCMNRCGNPAYSETTSVKYFTTETDMCMMPAEIGNCRARILMYAYYPSEGLCRRFYYGGCGGNSNRFNTYEECMNRCGNQTDSEMTSLKPPTSETDVCMMPAEVGPCRAMMPMYAFYSSDDKCHVFYYGGCNGNSNKFSTYEQCMKRCANQTDSEMTSLKPLSTETNVCMMPVEVGSCRAMMPMYAFYPSEGQCRIFYYGGCNGNSNRFSTYEECMNKCASQAEFETTPIEPFITEIPQVPQPRCMLPLITGPCDGVQQRYGFNKENGKCEVFLYGGCGGNSNNFLTLNECQISCILNTEDTTLHPYTETNREPARNLNECNKPQIAGNCRAKIQRFFYNAELNMCINFTYSGCGSNGNNFISYQTCMDKCYRRQSDKEATTSTDSNNYSQKCFLPIESGPCMAAINKYGYDKEIGECRQFMYGGCHGNENRFETITECQQLCMNRNNKTISQTSTPSLNFDEEPREEHTYQYNKTMCMMTSHRGPCRAMMYRIWYNHLTKNCERFIYGGCDGNGNNFKTQRECEETCYFMKNIDIEKTKETTFNPITTNTVTQAVVEETTKVVTENKSLDICDMPLESGPCTERVFRRFYFDKLENTCRRFSYSGCEGNQNNFETLAECENRCAVSGNEDAVEDNHNSSGPCEMRPSRGGRCGNRDTSSYRYYYRNGRCLTFMYLGCGGNPNNFKTEQDCLEVCGNQ